jgi:23S rRNA-/tRNA-specific pseudouridylate synthase
MVELMKSQTKNCYGINEEIPVKLYTTHRLDRVTSGVLIFTKNSNTANWISKTFEENEVNKLYLARVKGKLMIVLVSQ